MSDYVSKEGGHVMLKSGDGMRVHYTTGYAISPLRSLKSASLL